MQIMANICHSKHEKWLFLDFDFNDGMNKAGNTANTSCGRVGRGRNACVPAFRLERDGPTNQPTNQPTDGPTDGQSLL